MIRDQAHFQSQADRNFRRHAVARKLWHRSTWFHSTAHTSASLEKKMSMENHISCWTLDASFSSVTLGTGFSRLRKRCRTLGETSPTSLLGQRRPGRGRRLLSDYDLSELGLPVCFLHLFVVSVRLRHGHVVHRPCLPLRRGRLCQILEYLGQVHPGNNKSGGACQLRMSR